MVDKIVHWELMGGDGEGLSKVPLAEIAGTVTFVLYSDPAGTVVGLVESDVPDSGH